MEDVILKTDEPVEGAFACGLVCSACMEAELRKMGNIVAPCSPVCTACMEEVFKSV